MNVYADVRERDGHHCRLCGSTNWTEVHHIQYRSQGGPDEKWNLITLCKECHMNAHASKFDKWELWAIAEIRTLGTLKSFRRNVTNMCITCDSYMYDSRSPLAGRCGVSGEETFMHDSCGSWNIRQD